MADSRVWGSYIIGPTGATGPTGEIGPTGFINIAQLHALSL